eukprot:3534777-Pyramimonas_sp.AAC.1
MGAVVRTSPTIVTGGTQRREQGRGVPAQGTVRRGRQVAVRLPAERDDRRSRSEVCHADPDYSAGHER